MRMEFLVLIAVIVGLYLLFRSRTRRISRSQHQYRAESSRGDHPVMLVKLDPDQIVKAKAANGRRRQITHALLCGPFGQMFGTELQCRKYFDVWRPEYRIEPKPGHFTAMFPDLFSEGLEVEHAEIQDYHSTEELVTKLIEAQDNAKGRQKRR